MKYKLFFTVLCVVTNVCKPIYSAQKLTKEQESYSHSKHSLTQHFQNIWNATRCYMSSDNNTFNGCFYGQNTSINQSRSKLPMHIREQIASFRDGIRKIVLESINGSFKGILTREMNHIWGMAPKFENLESYLKGQMSSVGLSNIYEDPMRDMPELSEPDWSAIVSYVPFTQYPEHYTQMDISKNLNLTPLTNSPHVCRINQWKDAESPRNRIFVIYSLDEFTTLKTYLKNKVVVFYSKPGSEHENIFMGPSIAAAYGAKAILLTRPKINLFSETSLYIGAQLKIPAALIEPAQASLIVRYMYSGYVFMRFKCEDTYPDFTKSSNLFGNFYNETFWIHHMNSKILLWKLRRKPERDYVLLMGSTRPIVNPNLYQNFQLTNGVNVNNVKTKSISGVLGIQIVSLLKKFDLLTLRNIRLGIFAGSEFEYGSIGAKSWDDIRDFERKRVHVALQAGMGCQRATGLLVSASDIFISIIQEVQKLVEHYINKLALETYNGTVVPDKSRKFLLNKVQAVPNDMMVLEKSGVPIVMLNGDNGGYYYKNYSTSGTQKNSAKQKLSTAKSSYYVSSKIPLELQTKIESDELDKCLALMASTTYVLANLFENQEDESWYTKPSDLKNVEAKANIVTTKRPKEVPTQSERPIEQTKSKTEKPTGNYKTRKSSNSAKPQNQSKKKGSSSNNKKQVPKKDT